MRIILSKSVIPMLIALANLFAVAPPASAAAPQVRTQAPGFYRMMLGDFEITALLDGRPRCPLVIGCPGGAHPARS